MAAISTEQIYEQISSLPKEYLEYFILRLIKDEKISFSDIAVLHTQYVEGLKKGETEKLMMLRSKVINLWCGKKKELPSKLVALIQEGKNSGWVNITQEQIDHSKWNR